MGSQSQFATESSVLKSLVVAAAAICLTNWYWTRRQAKQVEDALAAQHGCKKVEATLPYKWPFAIDLLKKQYDALPKQRLLEFQTPFFTIAPTIKIDILGEGYIITDPVNIEAILNSKFEDFVMGSRREGLYPLLGEGIFTQDGAAILSKQFAKIRQAGLGALAPHAKELLDAISEEAHGNPQGVVDLQPHFFEYTLGTTTQLLFGEPLSALPKEERDKLRDNFDYASLISAIRLRLADMHWLYTPRKFREACKVVRDWASFFSNRAIDACEEKGAEVARQRYGFIVDLWLDTQDRNMVRDQLLHVLIAGRDTTACTLSWTFFHLVRNPRLIEHLRAEIAEKIGSEDIEITRGHIQQLPFLRCCLNETLRLYPQLPVNVRFAARPTILPRGGGPDGSLPFLLKKGAGVGWSTYHLHRLESVYGPDSRTYRPERWESGELIKKVGPGFVDFHAGPRVCLGKDYAIMEASYAIVRILQQFPGIGLPPGEPNLAVGEEKQNLTIVLSSAEGTKVVLE